MPGHNDVLCDCIVSCEQHGTRIPASTYAMVKASRLCETMLDDMLDRVGEQPRVFEFPVGDTFARTGVLQDVVDIIHKRLEVERLDDVDRVAQIIDAAEYLQTTDKITKKLSKRLWSIMRSMPNTTATFDKLLQYSGVLLDHHHAPFLSKARNIAPEWHVFRRILRGMDMFPERAAATFKSTVHIFPALLLLYELIMSSPDHARHDVCMAILSMYNVATYFHPDEYTQALQLLLETKSSHDRLVTPHCQIASGCITSSTNVNMPSSIAKVSGTFLLFSDKPKASLLMVCHKPIGHGCPKIKFQKGIGCMWISRQGSVGFKIQIQKLPHSTDADCSWVRVCPMYSTSDDTKDVNLGDVVDAWSEVTMEDASGYFQWTTTLPRGTDCLRFVRIDVFWLHDPRSE